jgi:hypothetical protein
MVADGHLMTVPVNSVYSGVVSLCGIWMLVFLVEMNGLQTWSTDISNAYLKAEMKEKVFFVAGPEFDDLAEHTQIVDVLERKYKFKLKGTGPIAFQLGMGFSCDDGGVLCLSPKRYIERMISTYVTLFGTKPSMKYNSPLEKGDHPEIDDSEFLDATGIQQYQSLIGALQWSVSIGRFDITMAVMTMSSFRAMPRLGHMARVKCLYGYLAKRKHGEVSRRKHGEVSSHHWTSRPLTSI